MVEAFADDAGGFSTNEVSVVLYVVRMTNAYTAIGHVQKRLVRICAGLRICGSVKCATLICILRKSGVVLRSPERLRYRGLRVRELL